MIQPRRRQNGSSFGIGGGGRPGLCSLKNRIVTNTYISSNWASFGRFFLKIRPTHLSTSKAASRVGYDVVVPPSASPNPKVPLWRPNDLSFSLDESVPIFFSSNVDEMMLQLLHYSYAQAVLIEVSWLRLKQSTVLL